MENGSKFINLTGIAFPVYKLGKQTPSVIDGVSFYMYNIEGIHKVFILDDKTIPYDSLAKRRLKLLSDGVKLKRINKAIFFLGDFIKLATKNDWFIDSKGKLFQYEKTTRVPLIFKKITKLIPIKTGGLIVEVSGVGTRFKTLYTTDYIPTFAGLLKISETTYILYGLYDKQYKNTTRKI